MAFRKRKKIANGLFINLTSKGISFNYKLFPGLSFTLGSQGLYCNTGIPGTGITSRHKLVDSGDKKKKEKKGEKEAQDSYARTHHSVYSLFSESYRGNHDIDFLDEYNKKTLELTSLHQHTPHLITSDELQEIAISNRNKIKEKEIYSVPNPILEDFDSLLQRVTEEAQRKTGGLNKKKREFQREQYIKEKIQEHYDGFIEDHKSWTLSKLEFENQEDKTINEQTRKYQESLEGIQNFVDGSPDYIDNCIAQYMIAGEIPFASWMEYAYDPITGLLKLSLEVPTIDEFPQEKAKYLCSGEVVIRDKSQKELLHEYATCVTGLAFYIAGMMFNISMKIKHIQIMAYATPSVVVEGLPDHCLYDALFSRKHFSRIEYGKIDPIIAIQGFPSHIRVLSNYEFREVLPFTEKETQSYVSLVNESDNP